MNVCYGFCLRNLCFARFPGRKKTFEKINSLLPVKHARDSIEFDREQIR
jgi:hypothetical protein